MERATGNQMRSAHNWAIYTLATQEGEVRYVGVTTQGNKRLSDHLSRARRGEKTHKDDWLRSLQKRGELPIFSTVEVGGSDAWREAEQRWIAHYLASGARLTNLTIGGEGCRGYRHSEKDKQLMAEMKRGQVLTEEHKKKISATQKGRPISAALLAALKGRKRSQESIEKSRSKFMARDRPPEWCANISNAKKGRPISDKARASRPKVASESHRASISEALKRYWSTSNRRTKSERQS